MKIVFSDYKKGEVKLKVENLDDLWCLSQVIDENDIVKGETTRKIKLGQGENQDAVRKQVFLSIRAEKTEFSKQSTTLRILGTIVDGPEDVPRGTHHAFTIELNDVVTVVKETWLEYQIQRIKEASEDKQQRILLVVFDREEAHFALATAYGYDYLSGFKGDVQKKEDEKKIESTFYADLVKQTTEYMQRYKIERIVVASPAFWKDYFMKQATDPELKRKIIAATCSSADKSAFNEVLRRPEVESALKESRAVEEIGLVEDLLKEIMRGKIARYGKNSVKDAADAGAIKIVLITDTFIQKTREENTFKEIEKILKLAETAKGTVKIISGEHEGGKKLDGLGGIAAILRYEL